MVNYTRRAVRGAATIFIFSILAGFIGYLVRVLFARNLSVEEFGLFYAVFTLISFIAVFRDLGLNQALVKYIPEFLVKKRPDLVKSSIVTVGLFQFVFATIIAVILFLLSDWLALNYFHSQAASLLIILLGISLFFLFSKDIIKYSFQGFQKINYFTFTELGRVLAILAIALIGFNLGLGIVAPAIAYMLYPLVLTVIFYPIFIKKVFPEFGKIKMVFNKNLTKKLFKFGLPVVVGFAGMVVLGYTDVILLTYYSGLKEVGLYNVALPTAKILTYFSAAIGTIFFPMFAELWAKKDKKRLRYGIENIYKYLLILIIPFALIMFSFPTIIIRLLFGSTYIKASLALQILSIGIILFSLAMLNFNIINGLGKPKINTKIVYVAALFNLIFNFILIPKYGIIGAASTTLVSYGVMFGLSINWIRKYMKVKLPWMDFGKILILGLAFVGVILWLKKVLVLNAWLEAIICVTAALIVYLGLVFLIRLQTIEETKKLLQI